jgi:hypothetical protein
MPITVAQYIIIGSVGSDAGYWVWDGHGWKHVGGWAIDQLAEVRNALTIMGQASQLKTPGLANTVTKSVGDLVTKELGAHLGQTAAGGAGTTTPAGTQVVVVVVQ